MRVLLIADSMPEARALRPGLEKAGVLVDFADTGPKGFRKACQMLYDLILLDLPMSGEDGFSFLRNLHQSGRTSLVLALTAPDRKEDLIRCLDLGADACLAKPLALTELLARMRALVRSAQRVKDTLLRIHDLEIDTVQRSVRRAGQAIYLTPREYALLEFLALHRGRVMTRTIILSHVYGNDVQRSSNLVDVHIRYLRSKIDKGFELPLILTRWGQGYLLRREDF